MIMHVSPDGIGQEQTPKNDEVQGCWGSRALVLAEKQKKGRA